MYFRFVVSSRHRDGHQSTWACREVRNTVSSHQFTHLNDVIHRGTHDDVIKWKHFQRYWPLVRGIHRSPVNSPHKDQWRVALMFSLIYAWTNGWVNNWDAGGLRRHCAHYDVTVLKYFRYRYIQDSKFVEKLCSFRLILVTLLLVRDILFLWCSMFQSRYPNLV